MSQSLRISGLFRFIWYTTLNKNSRQTRRNPFVFQVCFDSIKRAKRVFGVTSRNPFVFQVCFDLEPETIKDTATLVAIPSYFRSVSMQDGKQRITRR